MREAEFTQWRVSSVKLPQIESMLVLWVQQCEGGGKELRVFYFLPFLFLVLNSSKRKTVKLSNSIGIILREEAILAKTIWFCELENIPKANQPKWSHVWLWKFKRGTSLQRFRFYGDISKSSYFLLHEAHEGWGSKL